jgi:hypothetical protein
MKFNKKTNFISWAGSKPSSFPPAEVLSRDQPLARAESIGSLATFPGQECRFAMATDQANCSDAALLGRTEGSPPLLD